jgi:hypothetical protein
VGIKLKRQRKSRDGASVGNAADRLRSQIKTNLANNQKRGVLASDGRNPAPWSVWVTSAKKTTKS